jgi:BRCA1-associated protein
MGGFLPRVREMRLVREAREPDTADSRSYVVLLCFDSASSCEEFYRFHHGRAFNSLEPHVCHLVFVKAVEYTHASAPPPAGLTELPACPVCLERLDSHISGIVTTVCNHTYHAACLSKWADASCPVCRFSHDPPDTPLCAACGASDRLWICLICGCVGCGRYAAGHAVEHWRASGHCYALELETQRVWDYLGAMLDFR